MKRYLFIDRDGTLIREPADQQVDAFHKLVLLPRVVPILLELKNLGYRFIMVSNQDGLGTSEFPQEAFSGPHNLLVKILESQGIHFEKILICPHLPKDCCSCRKPKIGLVENFFREEKIDYEHSYVIGDRASDIKFAETLGIKGIQISDQEEAWDHVFDKIVHKRLARNRRQTKETCVDIYLNLDRQALPKISTQLGFFDHMLEQLAYHGGFELCIDAQGDLHIDAHHTIEDVALTLGQTIKQAIGTGYSMERYSFLLPMDESLARIALDIGGRFHFEFEAAFTLEKVGDMSCEMVPHFFRSLAQELSATLHMSVQGKNHHHMIEALFKGFGRTLREAIKTDPHTRRIPSTKGLL